jgi:hypothetical protein
MRALAQDRYQRRATDVVTSMHGVAWRNRLASVVVAAAAFVRACSLASNATGVDPMAT